MQTVASTAAASTAAVYAPRYAGLDSWRGLAALTVVLHHIGGPQFGHIAVLVFFVISGYCITASAESCARNGMRFQEYMWRRIRRIYPPYLFSVLLYVATRVLKSSMGQGNDLAQFDTIDWIQNLTLTQWVDLVFAPLPQASANESLFVAAYWSLGYEEQFYLLIGLMMTIAAAYRRTSIRFLLLALAALGLCWNLLLPDLRYGLFIEYWAHFAVGGLVFYRLSSAGSAIARRLAEIALAALVVVGLLQQPWASWDSAQYSSLAEVGVAGAFGLLIIAMRPLDQAYSASRLGRCLNALGQITFSLYLIHQFCMAFVAMAVAALLPGTTPVGLIIAFQLVGHVVLATAFWWACERPFLNSRNAIHEPHLGEPPPRSRMIGP